MQVYPTQNGIDNVLLQPGVIMISELRMAGKRFDKEVERAERNARRNGRDDTMWRLKRDVFVRAVLSINMTGIGKRKRVYGVGEKRPVWYEYERMVLVLKGCCLLILPLVFFYSQSIV